MNGNTRKKLWNLCSVHCQAIGRVMTNNYWRNFKKFYRSISHDKRKEFLENKMVINK